MPKFSIQNVFLDNSFLKVLSVKKASPLRFQDRLLYSLLVFLSAKNYHRSQVKLARLLCVDRGTVRRAANRLAKFDLVETDDSGKPCLPLQAKQPGAESENWFVPINAPGKPWQHSMGYVPVPWPDERLPDGLSWKSLLIYSFLFRRTQVGSNDKLLVSAETISRILQLDGRSVRKALGELEAQLLIQRFPGHRILLSFPGDDLKKHFRTKRKVERPARFSWDRPWEDMTEVEIDDFIEDAPNDLVRLWRIMRFRGHYATSEIEVLRKLWHADVVDSTWLAKFYHNAERDHRKSQEEGKFQHNSSYKLLLHRLIEKYGTPKIEAALTGRQ